MIRTLLALLLLFAGGAAACAEPGPGPRLDGTHVLIFSHSTGFRHESIDTAVPGLGAAISAAGGVPVASEDPDFFSAARLATFDAIILVSTPSAQQAQF